MEKSQEKQQQQQRHFQFPSSHPATLTPIPLTPSPTIRPTPTPSPPSLTSSLHTQHTNRQSTSRSSSRRNLNLNLYERLPTPPPDPRFNASAPPTSSDASENIFKYPSDRRDIPEGYQNLLNHGEREREFYKTLNKVIQLDCKTLQAEAGLPSQDSAAKQQAATSPDEIHSCVHCKELREECEQYICPLHARLDSSIATALAAYGAVEQLARLYSMWDQYFSIERRWRQNKERLRYANLLNEKMQSAKAGKSPVSDTEIDLDQSIAVLDSILEAGYNVPTKRVELKPQRERSKSVMADDISQFNDASNLNITAPLHLRRQSTYSEGKAKVSKWTKVKAAFKWERANMPAVCEFQNRDTSSGFGLTPINAEVARYLRVPSNPCGGGSSADSILSSSSGHLLSETGTPGSISSASSMDDIENSCRHALRRDSSKSDTRCESRITDDGGEQDYAKDEITTANTDMEQQQQLMSDLTRTPIKSSSNKSLRKSKIHSDFEVLHENVVADIKSTPSRRTKLPPSPLNLNLKQDLNDLDSFYSPNAFKSPKDGTWNRLKKFNSPGNSSVPSSPSRHSDFYAEFESEDISSGDFSEPTSPNNVNSRKSLQQKQDEINQRYQLLRAKLDLEFENKRREWEKIKANQNILRGITFMSPPKCEENATNQTLNANLSAKLLEENLTPDFKKKLRKWRVKKQISVSAHHQNTPTSPHKEAAATGSDTKAKIDWNLWKTGQMKLEGQGLSPLPDQKNLPEEFQKKLEQWDKIKRGGSTSGTNDSIKRHLKPKCFDDDRSGGEKEKRSDKHKPHDNKDKLERLAKLKAIVTDHPSKQIQVKTSAGVMKFEGISRKFTRKLYEWEKARGIGPESSTFALLHPGYCPIDVGRISKEAQNSENSPTLSRSLSLDSISPNITLPMISQQASSLSLNDVNDFKEIEGIQSSKSLADSEFKKYEEPEAVMVEVEDHIVETASPLIATHTLVEQQTPIYKYEEMACNDYCNSRRIQSYESHTNLAPLLSAVKRTEELLRQLESSSPDIMENEKVRHCKSTLSFIRTIYPYYTENLMKANVLNAISDVQSELSRISALHQKSPLDEACCQEMMEERHHEYNEEFDGLHESLELLRNSIHGNNQPYPKEIVPDINITSEDGHDSSIYIQGDTRDRLSTTLEATDELSGSHVENDTETNTTVYRNFNNSNNGGGGGKKKLRLRKMGSRQNSKTESDSSTDDDTHSVLETPRRMKRKNFRLKQRSFEEEGGRKVDEFQNNAGMGDDAVYVLKMKPQPSKKPDENGTGAEKSSSKILIPPYESCFQLITQDEAKHTPEVSANANVFVKTKRKVFTTVEEPNAARGIAVIEHDVINAHQSNNGESVQHHSTHPNESKQASVDVQPNNKSTEKKNVAPNTSTAPSYGDATQIGDMKSLSLCNVRKIASDYERRCHSAESIKSANKLEKGIREPLASDSFRVIHKSCFFALPKDVQKFPPKIEEASQSRKEHRFKKNTDGRSHFPHGKTNGATVKKIEIKVAKTNSGSSVDQVTLLSPDRTDNTMPKICRKLERKSLTPTTNPLIFEYPTPTNSDPSTPDIAPCNKPSTPLSERALRLRKAKEEFLQGTLPRTRPNCKRRDEIVRNDTWEQCRRSNHSAGSLTGEVGNLLKSTSVDTFNAETPTTQSDAGTDIDSGLYDSLPIQVTRSGKISSKLGFATLASKFRRATAKKDTKPTTIMGGSNSALSTLCRQTLLTDVIAVPQLAVDAQKSCGDSVKKSKSSPQAGGARQWAPYQVANAHERLNKSQSEQYVKCKKESYV